VSPGSVVVIATNGHRVSAVVGGLMGLEFRRKGCGGVVVDGGVRDSAELIDLGLPTFCRYVTPLISARRWRLTVVNKAISLPGQASDSVTVEPSDLIVGDADGVLVVPRGIAAQVIAWSEELASIEEKIVGRLKAGEAREAVFAALPRFAHIRPLRG
jgi:regulator of RNase E activity RraA